MIRRFIRIGVWLGLAAATAVALSKVLGSREHSAGTSDGADPAGWPPLPDERPAARAAWVEPTGGVCPTSHPIKAKLSSKIFHLPGTASYERTNADRCYAEASQAEADGLRPAKR